MSQTKIANVVNVSGGKDSAATALLAIEREVENPTFVFADTGHEHPQTYDYVDYLDSEFRRRCGVGITIVKADFARQMEHRRRNIWKRWATPKRDRETGRWQLGVPLERVMHAESLLHPTGIPMLDLCMLRGRFPSTQARFCTQELKVFPVDEQVIQPLAETHDAVVCWHGVRADESKARANLPEFDVEIGAWEPEPHGVLIRRPIITWTADDVFAMHRRHNLDWNPLYEQGLGRVGCMPCIHARKHELAEIARRWPEQFERLARWEAIVSEVSKRGISTFFAQDKTPGDDADVTRSDAEGVREWATRGGQSTLFDEETSTCSSIYGLCE